MTEAKEEDHKFTKTISNEIYFNCEVTPETVAEFNQELRKLDIHLRKQYIDLGIESSVPTIKIFINSPGGDLHCGLSAMDHISMCKSHTITIADGCAASAAALMFLGGKCRRIKRNSFILIHQLSSEGVWGTYNEMRAELANCDILMKQMKSICTKRTQIPEHKLDLLMNEDMLLSAKKCIKYGVVEDYYE